jgi:hypothetical protein
MGITSGKRRPRVSRIRGGCKTRLGTSAVPVGALTSLAATLSESTSTALAVFYDNGSGVRAATVFRGGTRSADLGEDDEWWAPLDDDGEPRSSPRRANRGLRRAGRAGGHASLRSFAEALA